MIKILIIEDELIHFNNIEKKINDRILDAEVYPKRNSRDDNFNSFEYLIDKLYEAHSKSVEDLKNTFSSILEFYKEKGIVFDFFIIDSKIESNAYTGLEIVKYLEDEKIYHWAIYSSVEERKWKEYTAGWKSKIFEKKGRGLTKLLDYIVKNSEIRGVEVKLNPNAPSDKWYDEYNIERLIVRGLKSLVYVLFVGGFMNVIKQLVVLCRNEKHDFILQLLDFSENLFLSFLPFFITFGFLGYYRTFLTHIWWNKYIKDIGNQEDTATSAIKFSKILFTSSIAATVIIKILEKLIDEKKNEIYLNDPMRLLPLGVLLVLLMIYYMVLQKKH